MYLQITTKCNMTCDHCGFSCSNKGKHGDYNTIINSINFIIDNYDNEYICIGGGEPTLHPKFFDILKYCMNSFNYVWLATNGSQTDSMYRLSNIIDNEDYEECDCSEEDIEGGYCNHWLDIDNSEDKLSIALSQDSFHDPIDNKIIELWKNKSKYNKSCEIRNVNYGVINAGRAKINNIGQREDRCICNDIFITPAGNIKACGCSNAPFVGDIYNGLTEKGEKLLNNKIFREDNCYNYYLKNKGYK